MKSNLVKTLSLGLVAVALTLVPTISHAADQTNAPAATPKKSGYIPFHGVATAVDKNAETLTVGKQVFNIASTTKITYATNNAPALLSDITVGEKVSGSYVKDASGKLNAHSIHIGTKNKEMTKPAKKKKATTSDSTSTNSVSN